MPRFHNIDGVRVRFTLVEEHLRDQEEAKAESELKAKDATKLSSSSDTSVRVDRRESAIAKLISLGLTTDEIGALI